MQSRNFIWHETICGRGSGIRVSLPSTLAGFVMPSPVAREPSRVGAHDAQGYPSLKPAALPD